MGNTTTLLNENEQDNLQQINNQLTYVSSKQHKYLGQIQLWKNKDNLKMWVFSKTSQTSLSDQIIVQEHSDRKKLHHNNLLKYYGATIKESAFQLPKDYKIYFEYIPISLQDCINARRIKQIRFEESYLWKIIHQISQVSQYLETQNKYHSDLNTDSIFINDDGNIKILYHGALNNLITAYAKLLTYADNNVILSPKQLNELKTCSTIEKEDPLKNDAYQFGIILLQMVTLNDPQKLLDYYKATFKYHDLLNLLGSSRKYYSQQLLNLIVSLLQYYESSRMKLSQLFTNKLYKSIPIQSPRLCQTQPTIKNSLQSQPSIIYQQSPKLIRVKSQTLINPLQQSNNCLTKTVSYQSLSQSHSLITPVKKQQKIYASPQISTDKRSLSYLLLSTKNVSRVSQKAFCRI